MPDIESKILDMLLSGEHFALMIGIFSILLFLKKITPIAKFLFDDKWKWIIPIINLVLSCIGIFLFKMTDASTIGMKFVIVVLISAVTSYAYENSKYAMEKIANRISPPPVTPIQPPPPNP